MRSRADRIHRARERGGQDHDVCPDDKHRRQMMATPPLSSATVSARTYTAGSLQELAFPLGGIGTGTVSLGGRGQLRDWEIFNRPGKGKNLGYTFFSLWAQPEGSRPQARV